MAKNSQDFSQEDIRQLAKSPAARQLMELLRRSDPEALSEAMDQAAAGNYQRAITALGTLMEDKEAKALLAQLGGGADG